MANTVLIIGNGFDIDLGLKSKYTDFILGSEWKNVCELIKERFPEKFHTISLLMHLLGASENKKLWFDVEYEIHEFIKKCILYCLFHALRGIDPCCQKNFLFSNYRQIKIF